MRDVGLAVVGFRLAGTSDLDVLVAVNLWILRLLARESQSRDFIMLETHPSEQDVKSPHTKRAALFCTFSR